MKIAESVTPSALSTTILQMVTWRVAGGAATFLLQIVIFVSWLPTTAPVPRASSVPLQLPVFRKYFG